MNSHPSESRAASLLSYCVLLGGLATVLATTYLVITTYSPLPHWDEWQIFDYFARSNTWSLGWLWAQHNEHRIFFPKIFYLIDIEFFRGTQVFLLASIWLIQLLQVILLGTSLRVLGGLRGAAWRTGVGLIAFCIFCPTQYENLVWGFQVQFVLPAVMLTLSLMSLLLFWRDGSQRSWLLAVSIAAATVATFSLANGMLLWPLLLFAALLLRMKRLTVLEIFVSATVNIGLYFYHYRTPEPHESFALSLQSFLKVAEYVVVYFGSTWVRHSSGAITMFAGVIGVCAAIAVMLHTLRKRQRAAPFVLLLSLLMLFCLVTAGITSSGRLHLGLEQASASRYQTFALIFWCSLGLALLLQLATKAESPAKFDAFAALLVLMMVGFATQVRLPLIDAQWHQLRLKFVSLALMTGVHDPSVLADAFPDPQVPLRDAAYMKEHRLSIFAGNQYWQVGKALDAVYSQRPPNECSGYVASSQALPSDGGQGLRITGFAWDREANRPARDIVATEDGRIGGYGTNVAIPLNSRNAGPNADPSRYGFVAFVAKAVPGSKINLYAVADRNQRSVCRFAEVSP
jgi:hypothetical protein